jgi:hypothetical protein
MPIGSLLQVVSIETHPGCNLCGVHERCPNSLGVERYARLNCLKRLTDADILALIQRLYDVHGFRGFVNWSFYNEPTLELDRIFRLVEDVRERCPALGAMVHTNGTRLPLDPEPFRVFDVVWVTAYDGPYAPNLERVTALRAVCGEPTWIVGKRPHGVFLTPAKLDSRMFRRRRKRAHFPCLQPFKDLPFDCFGNAHICCLDWSGKTPLGNLMVDGIDAIVTRWEAVVRAISAKPMTDDAPLGCRTCGYRGFHTLETLEPTAQAAAEQWLQVTHG